MFHLSNPSYQGITRSNYTWLRFDIYLNYSDTKSVVSNLNALAIVDNTALSIVAAPAGVVADFVTTGYVVLLSNIIDKCN